MSVLMIVESPNKAKKIRGYYPDFKILPTIGHFRDLPRNKMGVEPPTHKPQYEIMDGKESVVKQIKAAAKEADVIYVATDPDREGEAIAAHVVNILGKEHRTKISRITYTEINKKAIDKAISNRRHVDWKLVSAQELRRVIDRYVGYMISPVLTKRLKTTDNRSSLTAGRVQSIALRLIVERDQERSNFIPLEHYGVEIGLQYGGIDFTAKWSPELPPGLLITEKSQAIDVKNRTTKVQLFQKTISFSKISPPKPLITSDYLKTMSKCYKLSSKVSMELAQKLFEAGLITYHRTDSHEMAPEFVNEVREFAKRNKLSIPDTPATYKAGKNAQQGHECLRVTDINLSNPKLVGIEDTLQILAYQLIWRFTLESQLSEGQNELLKYEFQNAAKDRFISQCTRIMHLGWRNASKKFIQSNEIESQEEEVEKEKPLPTIPDKTVLQVTQSELVVKHTEPPQQFAENSLVDKLEKMGIGRPSTYAQILETLIDRQYVIREKNLKLLSTELGQKVCAELKTKFSFMEYEYTAKMESDIDLVAAGKSDYLTVITAAYESLAAEVNVFQDGVHHAVKAKDGDTCPTCLHGKLSVLTFNVSGKNKGRQFIGCSSFPSCKFFQWLH
jgi:DNA topoisomerase-1